MSSRRRYARIIIIALVLIGVGLWVARAWRRPASEAPAARRADDPRLTYAGPFRNIHPDVAYVGDDKCAACHEEIARSYRQHPMGRSLLPIASIAARRRYDAAVHNPFEALGTLFEVVPQGERVVHRQLGRDDKGQAVYELDMSVDYVLGSGTRGHSYLSERDGYLMQTPISWYSQKQIWDKSPGFGIEERPGRPVSGECLFCHANRTRPRAGSVNHYETPIFDGYNIGCERCHGPGGRHIVEPGHKDAATGADLTIVSPSFLEPKLRAAVCEQCHLKGAQRVLPRGRDLYDFRPGLPLEAFWSVFVADREPEEGSRQAVGHVEQMYQSQCFLRSEEKPKQGQRKLGCTSCHDPHRHVEGEARVAYYRQKCLTCHDSHGCSMPAAARRQKSPEDSCISCHMPRFATSDIAHTAVTDHRILRQAGRGQPASSAAHAEGGSGGPRREQRFVPFYREQRTRHDPDLERDWGLAMIQLFAQGKADPAGAVGEVLDRLEAAVKNDAEDVDAREAYAVILTYLQRPEEALAAYEVVLAQAPHREKSLAQAAVVAQNQRQPAQALSYWRRAVAENPHRADYRADLSRLLVEQKSWDEARPQCAAWLRLDPASIEARFFCVRCLLKTGDKAAALAEFAKIQRLRPSNLPLLEARFAVESRAR
jgi:Tfp pilus assembly protein PilF